MLSIGEGTLAIPADWHNGHHQCLHSTAQHPGIKGPSITVNRDRLVLGSTLQDYVSTQTIKLAGQLKDYHQLYAQPVTVDGRVGHLLELTWNSPDAGEIHQILLTVAEGQTVLNFAATSPGKMTAMQRDELGRILLSFRFAPLPNKPPGASDGTGRY